jgi:hypothetical protein
MDEQRSVIPAFALSLETSVMRTLTGARQARFRHRGCGGVRAETPAIRRRATSSWNLLDVYQKTWDVRRSIIIVVTIFIVLHIGTILVEIQLRKIIRKETSGRSPYCGGYSCFKFKPARSYSAFHFRQSSVFDGNTLICEYVVRML